MSLIAMRNGLVTTFQTYGRFSASQISACDFGVIDLTTCAIVLQPGPNSTITPNVFQSVDSRGKEIVWEIYGMGFVKETAGDSRTLLGNLWTLADDIFNSVNSDDSLNNSVLAAHVATISRPSVDSFIETGGGILGFLTFVVRGTEMVESG